MNTKHEINIKTLLYTKNAILFVAALGVMCWTKIKRGDLVEKTGKQMSETNEMYLFYREIYFCYRDSIKELRLSVNNEWMKNWNFLCWWISERVGYTVYAIRVYCTERPIPNVGPQWKRTSLFRFTTRMSPFFLFNACPKMIGLLVHACLVKSFNICYRIHKSIMIDGNKLSHKEKVGHIYVNVSRMWRGMLSRGNLTWNVPKSSTEEPCNAFLVPFQNLSNICHSLWKTKQQLITDPKPDVIWLLRLLET